MFIINCYLGTCIKPNIYSIMQSKIGPTISSSGIGSYNLPARSESYMVVLHLLLFISISFLIHVKSFEQALVIRPPYLRRWKYTCLFHIHHVCKAILQYYGNQYLTIFQFFGNVVLRIKLIFLFFEYYTLIVCMHELYYKIHRSTRKIDEGAPHSNFQRHVSTNRTIRQCTAFVS